MEFKLLVSGYRDYNDKQVIEEQILTLLKEENVTCNPTIIHGHCPSGVDKTVDTLAKEKGWNVIREPAEWDKYKNAAGPIRNEKMITEYSPDYAILFLHPKSRGTLNMLNLVKKYNLSHTVVHIE